MYRPIVGSLAIAMAACGDSSGPNSDRGRAEAFIRDDPLASAASGQAAALFGGSIAGNARVSFSVDGSTWVDLGSANGITVGLQRPSDSSTVHGEADLAAGTYQRIRLTFSGVQARLDAGSVFGALTLGTQINVTLGGSDGEVIVEKTVPAFTVRAGTVTRVFIELNSEQWLTESSVGSRVVADAAVQQAVAVRTAP